MSITVRRVVWLLFAIAMALSLTSLTLFAFAATPTPGAPHAAMEAMGPQADQIAHLWRIFLATCAVVFGAILAALVYVVWTRPRAGERTPPDLGPVANAEPRLRRSVMASVVASALLLLALVVASAVTDRALARLSLAHAVNIEVTAQQWWWSVRYLDGPPSDTFTTANEIHVPVGRPVILQLKAGDVIHSLWVPNLAGKKDLIPGRSTTMTLRADQPGVYRGQCAEFCGFQHALMGLTVIADPPAHYEAWLAGQRQPAPEPADGKALRGRDLFRSTSCAMCHTVAGSGAGAVRGPDLTHVGSRMTLAAGTLKNTPADLAAWIADPQKHKPGTSMPATPMSREDLDAIVAYLGGLK